MRAASAVRVALIGCALAALAGCGTSNKHNATINPAVATGVAAQLNQRVLRNGELAGMDAVSGPAVATSATKWAAAGTPSGVANPSEVKRLQGLGFVAALPENLSTPGNVDRFGLSLVEEMGSHSAAVAEVAHAASANPSLVKFAVAGIPDAVGFEQTGASGGRNVAFADGRFYYLVGDGWNRSAKNAIPRATLIATTTKLYQRVRGLPGG